MEQNNQTTGPNVLWDWGTAYDFFISLRVLHMPAEFGLRGAWAAGVRSRLPAAHRETLEENIDFLLNPFRWIQQLPAPKDAATVLYTFKRLAPKERLLSLFYDPQHWTDSPDFIPGIVQRGSWTVQDKDFLQQRYLKYKKKLPPKRIEATLNFWANSVEGGEKLLLALQSYQDVFFAEEEKRILPKLKASLEHAQELAQAMDIPDLLEELTLGLRFEELPEVANFMFVPSYWSKPIMIYTNLDKHTMLMTYGARSAQDSLVPGEAVPDGLVQALKAMSDPTRLRILHYLRHEDLTPAELSRRLRLRAPTVTHHLLSLRLAGLVRFTLRGKNERLYSARRGSVAEVYASLRHFLEQDDETKPAENLERGQVW
ncbi:MAG: metalloregulator ArsR/SmtB family transcription factor [Anaerolineae bacterium]|nr:metalloregulator ArsR/SmtB family transcription factor [Anaerolineae bacterium]